jgi:calcineurin-like phosphoesterase family protein
MQNIFMISDMHFGHKNIMLYEVRPFKSVEDMDNSIIQNWNKVVGKNDKVFVLGDVSFYNKEKRPR